MPAWAASVDCGGRRTDPNRPGAGLDYRGVVELCANALPSFDDPFSLNRCYQGLLLQAAAELRLGPTDAAIAKLLDLRDRMEGHPRNARMVLRIPLQLELVEAYLAKRDLPRARLEADRMLEAVLVTAERTWQALACDASARVAIDEGDVARADGEVKKCARYDARI